MVHGARTHRIGWSFALFLLALTCVAPGVLAQQRQSGSGAPGGSTGTVGIIVKLEDDPVVSYRGGLAGFLATSPQMTGAARIDRAGSAVRTYRAHLARKHAAFEAAATAAIPGARVTHRYEMIFGGVAMRVPADQVSRVAQLPGVKAVYPDEQLQLHTDNSPTFIKAKALWAKLGGQDDAGEGVVVGILDTGIWPEHPSFADPDPNGEPYPAPPVMIEQCLFSGGANPGPAFSCNNKLIGAYRFMAAYDTCVAAGSCSNRPGDFSSARDSEGHGTHTSSTAAGNGRMPAEILGVDRRKVSGIAPRAHVVTYKVCGNGCFSSDSGAAIQQAIIDGVDVINFSISGGSDPYNDFVELAFRDAYAAGVFVAASAGNSGPGANTVDHRGPWVTTVGSSTQDRGFLSTVTVVAADKTKLKLTGTSITPGIATAAPVVVNADKFCSSAAAPGSFTGKIVICQASGPPARQSFNIMQGGAVGMILYSHPSFESQTTSNHFLPAVHLTSSDGLALLGFLDSHANVTATLTAGKHGKAQGDVMALSSSRGGTASVGVNKPDITAPGVHVLAGMTPAPAAVDNGPAGELFQAVSGTSMASPHIAGAAAVLKQLHPEWTPGQIKSAIMTAAATTELFKQDGVTPVTPFDAGSGRVDLKKALAPGLTFDVPVSDYVTHQHDLWNVNYPGVYLPETAASSLTVQRTAQSLLAKDSQWTLTVLQDSSPGLTVTVPPTITVPANGVATFDIGIDKSGIPFDQVRHATLRLKNGITLLHLPISAAGPTAPDLIVTSVPTPAGGTRGSAMSISFTVKNQGTKAASNFKVRAYLSPNTTLGSDDVPFASCPLASLAANTAVTCAGPVPISASIAAGAYFLVVMADDEATVDERDENNNIGVSPSSFTIN